MPQVLQAAGLAAAPKLFLSLAELPGSSKYWLGNLSTDVADDVAGVVECSALGREETDDSDADISDDDNIDDDSRDDNDSEDDDNGEEGDDNTVFHYITVCTNNFTIYS